ncbi:hypothetical protein [Aeromicrobium sp. P5_D10]
MTDEAGPRAVSAAQFTVRSSVLLALAAIQALAASLPWLSDDNDVFAFSAVAGGAALAAALIDRRNRWPWALVIAASIVTAVTGIAADGISAGEENEGALLGTAILMCAVVAVVAFLGAVRTLATPDVSPIGGWNRTRQVHACVIAVCGLHALLEGPSDAFAAFGIFVSAAAMATAHCQGRKVYPWVVTTTASVVSLAAYYPATSDYYERTAPAAGFQDSAVPEVVIFVAGLVMLVSAMWSLLDSKPRARVRHS